MSSPFWIFLSCFLPFSVCGMGMGLYKYKNMEKSAPEGHLRNYINIESKAGDRPAFDPFFASHKHSIPYFYALVKGFVSKINKFFGFHKMELCISYTLPIAKAQKSWYTISEERRASQWAADTNHKPLPRRSIRCNVTRRQYPPPGR